MRLLLLQAGLHAAPLRRNRPEPDDPEQGHQRDPLAIETDVQELLRATSVSVTGIGGHASKHRCRKRPSYNDG